MSKELRCGEIMDGCQYVIRGDSEEEVIAKGAEHARTVHGVPQLDPETVDKVRAAIRDV